MELKKSLPIASLCAGLEDLEEIGEIESSPAACFVGL
jgi:hypothetical protein